MNICSRFYVNPPNSFEHFTQSHKCEPHGGAKGKLGIMNMVIQVIVEIFPSQPNLKRKLKFSIHLKTPP